MNKLEKLVPALAGFWDRNQDAVITATAVVIVVLVGYMAYRFHKTKVRSRILGTIATVMTLAWESQGVWHTAVNVQNIPIGFAVFAFAVFEMLQAAAMFRAEEDRKEKGHPGWAGKFTFAIGITAGVYAALGEGTNAGVFQRIGLPLLVVSYYWYQLIADRNDDSLEVKALRLKMKEEDNDDSVWVNPFTRILIALGIKKPRGKKVTDADVEHRIALMVTYGYREYAGTFPRRYHLWRAGVIAGRSEEKDVLEARKRLDRRIKVEQILLPEGTRKAVRKQSVGQSGDGQSTERLASQSPVAGAVAMPVSRTSQLTSRLPVTQLTGQLATDGDRLTASTGMPSQSGGGVTGQSADSQSTATDNWPTDDAGLVDRLRKLIHDGAIVADRDGTVSVADARRAFTPPGGPQCGSDKARRVLRAAGLYREPTTVRGTVMRRPEDEVDDAPKVNGNVPHLAG